MAVDAEQIIRAMLDRGWHWAEPGLLVHPDDHELCLRHDRQTNRLSLSPKLNRHLDLVIPTPPRKH